MTRAASATYDPGSFRDPAGRVLLRGGRVFRVVAPDGATAFDRLVSSGLFARLRTAGHVVGTERCRPQEAGLDAGAGLVLEHERVPFVSYPYEWSFGMLRDAALLTLDVLDAALASGFTLKDATPYNIQFRGGRPILIDVLSLVPRETTGPWPAYRQFCETFLFPLMLDAYRGVDFQPLLRALPQGLETRTVARLFGWRDVFKRGVLAHLLLPARLQTDFKGRELAVAAEVQAASHGTAMIGRIVRRLRRVVDGLRPRAADSPWVDYADTCQYNADEQNVKSGFVREVAIACRPRAVIDLGSNTGELSAVLASVAPLVLAVDRDPATVDRAYARLREGSLPANVHPLVFDITNPSPRLGWNLAERGSLTDRISPDLATALALVHHLAITGNVTLPQIMEWLAALSPRSVIEYVDRSDAMVRRLLAYRDDGCPGYNRAAFFEAANAPFLVERTVQVTPTRELLSVRRREPELER